MIATSQARPAGRAFRCLAIAVVLLLASAVPAAAAMQRVALPSAPLAAGFTLPKGVWQAKVPELAGGLVILDNQGVDTTLAIRDASGAGCVYTLEGDAETNGADYILNDYSSWGCERAGQWDQEALVVDEGAISGSLDCQLGNVSFTLFKVKAGYQPPQMGATVSDRTVRRGQWITVRTRGFTPGTPVYVIVASGDSYWKYVRHVKAGKSGSNTIATQIPWNAPRGRGSIEVLGTGYDSVECQDACLGIPIQIGTGAGTLPDTSAAAEPTTSPSTRSPVLALVAFACLTAMVAWLQRKARARR